MSDERIRADVEELCSFEDRLAGTDAERRACNRLAERLRSTGRRATVEATYVQPQWALVHLLTCLIAVVGSVLAEAQALIGFLLVLFAAVSAYLDLNARQYLLRRLFFRRASQNVHTLPDEKLGPTVVLCANADSPRTGAVYNRLPTRIFNWFGHSFPVVTSPQRIWFWSIALMLPPLGARLFGFDPSWLAALQLPQTLILIFACFMFGEIALSSASPGANSNASGVAAVFAALELLDDNPPENLRVEAVIAGAGETTQQGMRSFIRSRRKKLDKKETWFISFELVGRGEPRFALSEGLAATLPMDPELAGLLNDVSGEEGSEDRRAEPMRDGRTSAAFVARAYGFPALPITAREENRTLPEFHHTADDTPENVDPAVIAATSALVADAVRLLDREVGRRPNTAD